MVYLWQQYRHGGRRSPLLAGAVEEVRDLLPEGSLGTGAVLGHGHTGLLLQTQLGLDSRRGTAVLGPLSLTLLEQASSSLPSTWTRGLSRVTVEAPPRYHHSISDQGIQFGFRRLRAFSQQDLVPLPSHD